MPINAMIAMSIAIATNLFMVSSVRGRRAYALTIGRGESGLRFTARKVICRARPHRGVAENNGIFDESLRSRVPPRRRLRAACSRRRGWPRHSCRRRQCDRSHARHGRVDRRGLSAHESYRRRRLLADPRAVRPRARADGRGARRGQGDHRCLSRRRPRRDPGARPARGAHRAGRGGGLDAGAGRGQGARRAAAARCAALGRDQARARGLHGDAQPGAR